MDNLPGFIRGPIVRNRVLVDTPSQNDQLKDIVLKVAETTDEFEQAFTVLQEEYLAANIVDDESSLRMTKYHLLPTTSVLIAKKGDEVIATMSVILDSPLGLPSESVYDFGFLRAKSKKIAEISSLAIKRSSGLRRGLLYFPFTAFLTRYCLDHCGIEYVVAGLNPRVSYFNTDIFGFRHLDTIRDQYSFVNVNKVAIMYYNLNDCGGILYKQFGKKPKHQNLYEYFFEKDFENQFQFPENEYFLTSDSNMNISQLHYFLSKNDCLMGKLNSRDKKIINLIYNQGIIPESFEGEDKNWKRVHRRFTVNCRYKLNYLEEGKINLFSGTLNDVSRYGFSIAYNSKIPDGDFNYEVQIQIGHDKFCSFKADIVRKSEKLNIIGFKILNYNNKWDSFIDHLEQRCFNDEQLEQNVA